MRATRVSLKNVREGGAAKEVLFCADDRGLDLLVELDEEVDLKFDEVSECTSGADRVRRGRRDCAAGRVEPTANGTLTRAG